jgi:2,4-didehydro-3-deoxy-L-rhamnonate hydrolase
VSEEFRLARDATGLLVLVDAAAYPAAAVLGGPATPATVVEHWDAAVTALSGFAAGIRAGRSTVDPVQPGRLLAPVQPRQVFQAGANYRSHVIQLRVAHALAEDPDADPATLVRAAAETMDQRAAGGEPYVFLGLPSALCGPYDDVVLPDTGAQHDWELELAVVISRRAYRVPRAEAYRHVAGYTVCNDLTTRDRVFRADLPGIGTDWLAGKNAPTFLPTGPYLVPAAFVPDPGALRITLRLNGSVMQDESTADMIFDIDRLIEHVSAIAPLLPGDLLLTGSPAGNGIHHGRLLRAGDVLTGEITGLGRQRNQVVGP